MSAKFGPLLSVMTMFLSLDAVLGASGLAEITAPTGPARRWEAGLSVGPFSQVNMHTGRVVTGIPVVGLRGRGPAVSFTLYHHMSSPWGRVEGLIKGDANLDGNINSQDISAMTEIILDSSQSAAELEVADFDENLTVETGDLGSLIDVLELQQSGPVWTHTYSTCLDFGPAAVLRKITIVWGDGTKDLYIETGFETGVFTPPAGVFSTLTADAVPGDGYLLTTKSQMKIHFRNDGRLDYIEDSSSNRQTCHYIDDPQSPADGELAYVQDAAGRDLELFYNIHGRLSQIRAPFGGLGNPEHRTWTLLYEDPMSITGPTINGDGPFLALEDPLGNRVSLTYTANHEIATITNKNDSTWQFGYSGTGRLVSVTDPLSQLEQFDYVTSLNNEGHYTDIRGKLWKFSFSALTQNLVATANPLNEIRTLAYADPRPQLVHEVTAVTNALNKTWGMTYDNQGNVLTNTNPLGHVTTFTYDALNNLRTMAPPDDLVPGTSNLFKLVEIRYEDVNHPTSPTSFIQPADGYGHFEAITTIDYYGDNEFTGSAPDDWNGQVYRVTGPNGVVTEFEYDEWGQQSRETENPLDPLAQTTLSFWPTVSMSAIFNPGGFSIYRQGAQRTWPNCDNCFPEHVNSTLDEMGNEIGVTCAGLCHSSCDVDPGDPNPGAVLTDGCSTTDPSATGLPLSINRCVSDPTTGESSSRDLTIVYDDFDRLLSAELSTAEPIFGSPPGSLPILRSFTNDYDDVAGRVTTTGPDGESVTTTMDDAGRTKTVTRTTPAGDITAVYTYDAAGRVTLVENGNGMDARYQYDDADQLTQIRYENTSDQSRILQLDHTYTADGLLETITETDAQGSSETRAFEYDFRNRLVYEMRGAPLTYDFAYTYDQGGNRLTKTNFIAGHTTHYHYDITDLDDGGQHNNRLLSSEVVAFTGETLERTWYLYGAEGNVARLVKETLQPTLETRVYWFYYSSSGQLWLAVVGLGDYDSTTGELTNVVWEGAAEYRHATGRQRYMIRPRDPNDNFAVLPGAQWSEYLGNHIYSDYTVDSNGFVTEDTAYLPGVGFADPSEADMPAYFASDQVGSTRQILGSAVGDPPSLQEVTYSAFGERLNSQGSVDSRYNYAGAYGYQSAGCHSEGGLGGGSWCDPLAELGWLHVGARYFDPFSGRFMQRDPIGVVGGLNVYTYVESDPMLFVDPLGTERWYVRRNGHSEVYFRDPDRPGQFIAFDFGPAGGKKKLKGLFSCAGAVNRISYAELPDGAVRYSSTPSEDAEDLERIKYQEQNPPRFSITGICGTNCLGWARYWATLRSTRGTWPGLGGCFPAGVVVHTANGPVPIEEIAIGATLLETDDSVEFETSRVTAVHRAQSKTLLFIDAGGDTIRCTPEHPFLIVGRGWTRAGDLGLNDLLLTFDGSVVTIDSICTDYLLTPVVVYNITVNGSNTFCIGQSGVVVHNKM
ncbi:MAG: hypothetical protein MI923_22145 [Phycisphaerales bacterium]|nr:hypothetical protein [Phycisphaerales bacterium]